MPKVSDKTGVKLQYPPGCREISDELSKDELLKRLKMLARAFQDMGQDENNKYTQLALYLSSEFFLDHQSKDVRLLVACCIADAFRIFAPEAPYTDADHIKHIFLFLTQQLRGLEDTEAASFKRYFYLLENLAWVKSFNICIELEDNQEIFCNLYKLMFQIVSEKHSAKVIGFMLDMMSPLVIEADAVSQELLDILFINIIEPHKSQNRIAYNLAKDLIKRVANALEPYVQTFFNNALMLGKKEDTALGNRLFDLIYELNVISPGVLLAVLPQLEFKLKSSNETDRKHVTKLLAKMFSDPDSELAAQNKPLWLCFLGRFNDIDTVVRRTCVQSAQDFIVNHPELVGDITEPLRQRTHDPDENVRMDVVQAVVGAAKKEFSCITLELLECVKERTLDKKFKIRKEALMGLGQIYKRSTQREDVSKEDLERVGWIRNKVLHAYYQTSLDDRVLVERILNIALVPYSLEPSERMKRLYHLYGNLDAHAVRALEEVFKTQLGLRSVVRTMVDLVQKEQTDEVRATIQARVATLTRNLPDPPRAQEYMKRLSKIVEEDPRIRSYMAKLVSPDCTCKKAEECVKEVLKKMGNAIPQNYLYSNVKMLLERIAPVMIDTHAIKELMKFIDDGIVGIGELVDEIPNPVENGMKLLLMLSTVFPGSFNSEEVFTQLIAFIKHEEEIVSDVTMEIFANTGKKLEMTHPQIYSSLLPVLQKMVKIGTPKQAKHAIRCINTLCRNKDKIFAQIFEHLKKNMDLDSPNFLSSLVAIGHIAQICPGEFATPVKGIVSKFIVKELLMQDRGKGRKTSESWYADHLVSAETQSKIQALKMMVRWLLGLRSNTTNSATSTLRLLHTMVKHEGDLMEGNKINKAEMARLRLQAGNSMLKLAQESSYADLITLDQFQTLALLLNDPCYQVRVRFAQKLHKGLIKMRLPLQYMSILCLAANDPLRERQKAVKQFLISNVQKRRDFLKTTSASNKIFSLLPDYVLPYAIHLLAHDPELTSHQDVQTLRNIKDCLWFILEPLITKNENYSYSFYRRMIENIKQTKDKQNPTDEPANNKMYAVCDLALGLVMTKTSNFVLKDFPAEPVLPAKLFSSPDQSYSNTRNYLPKELAVVASKAKKLGMPVPTTPVPAKTVESDKVTNGSGSPTSSDAGSEKSLPSPPSKSRTKPGAAAGASQRHAAGAAEPTSSTETSPAGAAATRPKTTKRGGAAARSKEDDSPPVSPRRNSQDDMSSGASSSSISEPPARNRKNKASSQQKGQGKITDFIKRSSRQSRDSQSSVSPDKSPPSSISSENRNTRNSGNKTLSDRSRGRQSTKRPASNTESVPSKKSRRGHPSPDTESESSNSRASPRKKTEQARSSSPVSKRRSRRSQSSEMSSPVPSPSSSRSASPPPKRRGRPAKTVATAKTKSNVRRASVMNGTSDGEEGTSESSKTSFSAASPAKKRTTSQRASEKDAAKDKETNVRRNKSATTRRKR